MRNLCGIVPLSVLASASYRWCHQAQGCALGVVTSLRKLRRPKAEAYKTRTVAEASPQPVSLREGAWVTRASRMPCAGCARLLRCVRLHRARLVSTRNYRGKVGYDPPLPNSEPS